MKSSPSAEPVGVPRAAPSPLEAGDEFTLPEPGSYCPTELLGTFTLLMAGHGRCVSADMMLGDRGYAMWQLASAHALEDEPLRTVSAALFEWFDKARGGNSLPRP